MNDEYVPFEERQRAEVEQRRSQLRETADAQVTAVAVANEALKLAWKTQPTAANSYLEVLVPARGIMKRRKAIVHRPGLRGGPDFHIESVMRAFRIPEAMYEPPLKDAPNGTWFDASVTEDGRVWNFRGSGVTHNTWQVLAATGRRLVDLNEADLRRIADGLSIL